ncbi:MAG: T9SS C-terminal target domain-containing protein [Bacteroidetes bacterium]|nr:MAG: T9SS C-terminal target domain-containing protein [Bacteroidota bacterium]
MNFKTMRITFQYFFASIAFLMYFSDKANAQWGESPSLFQSKEEVICTDQTGGYQVAGAHVHFSHIVSSFSGSIESPISGTGVQLKIDANNVNYMASISGVYKYVNGSIQELGDLDFVSPQNFFLEVGADGFPYIAYFTGNSIVVRRFQEGSWVTLGNSIVASNISHVSLSITNQNNIYLAYAANSSVYTTNWDTVSGTWTSSAFVGSGVYVNICAHYSGTAYVVSVTGNKNLQVWQRNTPNSSWSSILSSGGFNTTNVYANPKRFASVDHLGNLCLAYIGGNNFTQMVIRYMKNTTIWENLGPYSTNPITNINNCTFPTIANKPSGAIVILANHQLDGSYQNCKVYGQSDVCSNVSIPNIVTGYVNTSYDQTLTASNLSGSITWTIVGDTPNGIIFTPNSTTATLSGAPTSCGINYFTIQASNGTCSVMRSFTMSITPQGANITNTSLPNATQCNNYNTVLSTTGLGASVDWVLSSGSLPPGLQLLPSGRIEGVLEKLSGIGGTYGKMYNFSLKASSGACSAPEKAYSIFASPTTFNITSATPTLPIAYAGQMYSYDFDHTGMTPVEWSIEPNNLGLSINNNGTLSGIPNQSNSSPYNLVVKIKNTATGCTYSVTKTLQISCITHGIALSSTPPVVGEYYSSTLVQTAFNIANGTIEWSSADKDGLVINSSGVIQGTPCKQSITFNDLKVTQNGISSCIQNFIVISNCPSATLSETNNTFNFNWVCGEGNIYQQLTQTGLKPTCGAITWELTGGSLGGWILDTNTGVISGSLTNPNATSISFTVRAKQVNSGCFSTPKTYTGYPVKPPTITFSTSTGSICTNKVGTGTIKIIPLDGISNVTGFRIEAPLGSPLRFNYASATPTNPIIIPATGLNTTISIQVLSIGTYPFSISTISPCGISNKRTPDFNITGYSNATCTGGGGGGGGNPPLLRGDMPKEQDINSHLQITPNPVANELKLSGNAEMEYEVRLQDGQGKQIASYTGKLAEIEREMNKQVRNLKAGMYFVQFKPREGKAEVKKFVKVN